ncbi:hypothetical protein GCM10010170_056020 [Dactylosporangium salmoneum]|uniref:Uncharacterized protein n=1 Tax=Dactylosporangium salmoneum TaxID=53361 RepID=A0ABP5TSX9_9ACTN
MERDVYRLADLAPAGALVVRDRFGADERDERDSTGHRAFVAGTAASAAEDVARLVRSGVGRERIVLATIG